AVGVDDRLQGLHPFPCFDGVRIVVEDVVQPAVHALLRDGAPAVSVGIRGCPILPARPRGPARGVAPGGGFAHDPAAGHRTATGGPATGGCSDPMQAASFQLDPRWRVPLLFASILLIVVIPFLLMRAAENRIREADASVAHTLEVEATVQLINAAVRNIEAATLERALGARAPILEERLDYSSTIVVPSLDRLEQLTRDSPHQQVRVGTLRQSIAQRIDQVGRLLDGEGRIDGDELQRLAEHFPVQEPIAAMVRAEREFLAERQTVAARARRQADWLSYGTLAAQILLLVGLATLAMRGADRRNRAEAESQRANRRSGAV